MRFSRKQEEELNKSKEDNMEKKIYRVYAEEKKVKGYFQDVIASSKEEAQKLAEDNTEYHQWEDNPDEDGSNGIDIVLTAVLQFEEDIEKSSKYDELVRMKQQKEEESSEQLYLEYLSKKDTAFKQGQEKS